jgi:uncharacterized integral membrane protein
MVGQVYRFGRPRDTSRLRLEGDRYTLAMKTPTRRGLKIGAIALLLALAGLVIAQNTEVVSVRFLTWEFSLSRILLLGGALVAGFCAGYLSAVLRARHVRNRPD